MKLGKLCILFTDGDWIESKDQSDSGIRLIQTGNIGNGEFLYKNDKAKYISVDTFKRLNCKEVFPNDILVSRLPEPVGRGCIIPDIGEKMITAVDCTICRINENLVDRKYFCYFLESNAYKTQLEQHVTGTTRKRISRKNLSSVEIDIPEQAKQKEVVYKLDRLKKIIQNYNRELDLLDELVRARFVEMFGDVQDAKKHRSIQLKDICNTVTGGTPSTKHVEYYNGTIPWISTVSLGPNYIDGTTAKAFITQEAVDNSSTKIIPSGSILFGTRVGVGKSSINQVEMCTNQDIVAIIDLDESKYNKLYIKYVLDTYQSYFDSIKKGATILGISSDDLKNIYVPDASLYEQDRFEKFVKQIDKSRSRIQKSLEASQELFDSLMQEYFS